jgi:hypothetical protein
MVCTNLVGNYIILVEGCLILAAFFRFLKLAISATIAAVSCIKLCEERLARIDRFDALKLLIYCRRLIA